MWGRRAARVPLAFPVVEQQALQYRQLLPSDFDVAARLVADALAGYREFAPPGWRPPDVRDELRTLRAWGGDGDFWGQLALEDRTPVGYAAFVPALRHRSHAVPEAGLSHLGKLFVVPAHWGRGTASTLLQHAIAAARERGFSTMRLFTPEGQSRARRFYEREGFRTVGGPREVGLGIPVFEYRRPLHAEP